MPGCGHEGSADLPFIAIGTARLPKSVGGDQGSLLLELVLDSNAGCVIDVASTVLLPGYTGLLRRLLIGCRLDQVEEVARDLAAHFQGPLLRPTIAALTNAAANVKNGSESQ